MTEADISADEQLIFKKRARRRLVGAVALALLAAIILPWVMDNEPPPQANSVQVRLLDKEGEKQEQPIRESAKEDAAPAETTTAVQEKPLPVSPATHSKPAAATPENILVAPTASASTTPPPAPPAVSEANATTSPVKKGVWLLQFGLYADKNNATRLIGKLKEKGLPAYSETIESPKGLRTRVRAGPYNSRAAAEKALAKAKLIGMDGSIVAK